MYVWGLVMMYIGEMVFVCIINIQTLDKMEKPTGATFLKSKQRLMPLNNKQNSNNIFRKLTGMDGRISSHERRPPRSLKHIQTQTNSENSAIINVNALLEKNKTHHFHSIKKVEDPDTSRLAEDPTEPLPFRQAIQLQIQIDVQQYLLQARKKNKKKRMLHKKQGRRFSNPDEFSTLKNL